MSRGPAASSGVCHSGLLAPILTADAFEERIRAAGCDGDIAKPMRYQEFLATIAARLGRT
jgi:hypothetical protein